MKAIFSLLFCAILLTGCFSTHDHTWHNLNAQAPNGVGNIASCQNQKCVCPLSKPITRQIDMDELWAQKRSVTRDMWERTTPILTADQKVMRDAILMLANSDSRTFQQIAFVNTAWVWNYLPYASQKPQLCSFAKVINATVEWHTTRNPKILIDAIQDMSTSLINGAHRLGNNAAVVAGCSPISVTFQNTKCYENGLVHNIDASWKNTDILFPCVYENIAKKLYKSTSYIDRLMATVATACTSQIFLDLPGFLDEKLLFDIFRLQVTSPIPQCCCDEFRRNIVASAVPFVLDAPKSVAKIVQKLKNGFAADDYLPPY